MDAVTARVIDKGRKNERLLIQPQYHPWPVAEQIAVIYCGVHSLLENVPMDKVFDFEQQFVQLMQTKYAETLKTLAAGKLTEQAEADIKAAAADVAARFHNA